MTLKRIWKFKKKTPRLHAHAYVCMYLSRYQVRAPWRWRVGAETCRSDK